MTDLFFLIFYLFSFFSLDHQPFNHNIYYGILRLYLEFPPLHIYSICYNTHVFICYCLLLKKKKFFVFHNFFIFLKQIKSFKPISILNTHQPPSNNVQFKLRDRLRRRRVCCIHLAKAADTNHFALF